MLFDKFKEKPDFNILHLFGGMFIALGYILFLTLLHILTIETTGDLSAVLNRTFITFLFIFYALMLFAIVYIIYKFMHWLVYETSLPKWYRIQKKEEYKIGK